MPAFRARTREARARARTAKSPTRLGDVARLARVSTATVSRAINETGAVSEATRRKVALIVKLTRVGHPLVDEDQAWPVLGEQVA